MIRQAEIQKIANQAKVRDTQIEKDYAITWILIGVAKHQLLSNVLAFKGGTVLKKCYFQEYRFSEDLDFTLLDSRISNETLQTAFQEVANYLKEEVNMEISIFEFAEHKTENINFYLNYIGPLGGSGNNKSVKVDISKNEVLQFQTKMRPIFNIYADQIASDLQCYSLEEVIVEKLRSLLSRTQPRDFYDLWYLTEIAEYELYRYKMEFEEKCKNKNVFPENLEERLEKVIPIFKTKWKQSIQDQIQNLPEFEQVSRELGKHFRKLFKN